MLKLQFIGRVLPEPVKISVHAPEVKWKWQEVNLEPVFRVNVANSLVNVECDIERYEPTYLPELYRRAFDLARAAINLVAFASGYGVNVILETFIDPTGARSALIFPNPSLPPLCTTFGLEPARQPDLDAIFQIIFKDPPLFMALNDLIGAITLPHVAPVNCARAMEALKHLIADPSSNDRHAWEEMRDALQIDKSFLTFITDNSAAPRHAQPGHIPGTITTEVTRRSWIIMDRFLEYRKRGSKPLPSADFSLLKA